MQDGTKRQVKTAVRVFDIVDKVQERDGARLVDIADALDVSKSTAHQYLSTLVDLGYLKKVEQEYTLGHKFLNHGIHARKQYEITEVCRPTLENLVEETQEMAWVTVEEQGKAVYLDKVKGKRAVQTLAQVGTSAHLHYLASGRAMLASMSDEDVREIIDRHGLPARTEESITDTDALFDELEEIHDRGYAINDGDATPGVRAVGASVTVNGDIYGAIAVTGPAHRLDEQTLEEEIAKPVLSATNEIELKLGYQIE
ncbi:IclR family transcriptional regulator [Natrinema salifodinae]|uniref:Transcriptional regulator, IclR family n=1 Tax=Natrinema salifodinae TaxID=1202768 RepID=A0A1I0LXI6_9EURY|nr:IclR family transcriptional regulator [Natrinema salifodinae]SEV80175.1 transcriptional regulator, IclR family [Natrinema salifodinae]